MSDIIEILKLVGGAVRGLVNADRDERAQVAQHFLSLSRTFNAFPPAQRARDFDEMRRLAAKTHGLLDGLRDTAVFTNVLGSNAAKFFETITAISNAKDMVSEDRSPEQLVKVVTAAGYFEGYYEVLAAEGSGTTKN